MTYCEYINTITGDKLSLHKEYHDNHYGFPVENDDELFEVICPAHIVPIALYMNTLNC